MTLGAYLRSLREERRDHNPLLSVREAARLAGVDYTYLSRVEQGKVPPSVDLLERLAPILQKDLNVLLGMAGKLSARTQERICQNPHLFELFLQQLEQAPLENIEHVARQVRDGNW